MTGLSQMKPAEAWQHYSFADDPIGWHHQPVCVCGDYVCQHEKAPPHRCGFTAGNRCGCFSYRFSRMGTGSRPEDEARWIAQGCPPWAGDAAPRQRPDVG